jgi:ribosomal protein S25
MESTNPTNITKTKTSEESSDERNSLPTKGTRRLRRKNYEKINDEIRKKIIFEVTVLGNKLKTICEKLNINVSSAKNVLAIYKKEGRIEKKKYRVKRRKTADDQESAPDVENSSMPIASSVDGNNLNFTVTAFKRVVQNNKIQSEPNLKDMSIDSIMQNYCTCPSILPYDNIFAHNSMEEYCKNFSQLMNTYNNFYTMGMM